MNKKTGLLSIILLLTGIALYAASMLILPTEDMLVIPDNYEKLLTMQLSEKHENYEIYKLEIKEQVKAGFYTWTNSKDEKNIMLEGSNNVKIPLFAAKDNLSSTGFTLQPGSYSIKLTNNAQTGKLVIYSLKNTPANK